MARVRLLAGGSLVLFLCQAAGAQSRDAATAEALFNAGREALERGEHELACSKLEESHRLDPAAGTLLNIGQCSEALGRLVRAWQSYSEASQMLTASDPRAAYAKQRLDGVTARVPWLTLRLAPGSPQGTSVVRDGATLGEASFGVPIPVDPPSVSLIVKAPGRRDNRVTVEIAEGQKREVVLELGPERTAPAPAAAPPAPTSSARPRKAQGSARPDEVASSGSPTLGYVLVGAGALALITSGVATALMLSKQAEVEDDCDTDSKECRSQAGVEAAKAGATLSAIGAVAFGAGIAASGLGVYFILSSGSDAGRQREAAPAAAVSVSGAFR